MTLSHRTDPRPRRRSPEEGYNMVVLMVAITVLMVFVAAALPMWSQVMQREKEAELISRGWQYAEAIRVFQQRHGRYPTRLEELMEVKPRSIRKLWEEPMSESGEWGLVFQGGVAPPGGEDGQGRELVGAGGPGEDRNRQRGRLRTPERGERRTVGSIIGVRSYSDEESIRVLFGEQSYDAWLFTVEQIGAARATEMGLKGVRGTSPTPVRGAVGPGGRPILPRTEWIGKPFPEGIQPQGVMSGSGPGEQGAGNRPTTGPNGRSRQRPGSRSDS